MSEKPIIFSAESVRAILAGRKTQTRRVVRPQLPADLPSGHYFDAYNGGPQWNFWTKDNRLANGLPIWRCPYGVPGDRLWVRETLEQYWEGDVGYHTIRYACDKQDVETDAPESWDYGGPRQRCILHDACTQTIPSIHMPKWAARLWLEVVEVRVERVQDITCFGAKNEGVDPHIVSHQGTSYIGYTQAFVNAWDRLNAKRKMLFQWTDDETGKVHSEWVPANYGWDANPWVWVIRFKRSEA